jgi:hypothetical protein
VYLGGKLVEPLLYKSLYCFPIKKGGHLGWVETKVGTQVDCVNRRVEK